MANIKIPILSNIRKLLFKLLLIASFFTLSSRNLGAQIILLKSGGVIRGQIKTNDTESLAVTEENGTTRSVSKKSILKILNHEATNEDLDKIRKEEELKIEVERKQIEGESRELEAKRKEIIEQEKIEAKNKKKALLTFYTSIDKNCKEFSSSKDWFWLFGNFSITKPKWAELIPKDSKAIRIRQEASLSDTLISIFIGYAITITRKTTYIDVCEMDDSYEILSKSELEIEKNHARDEIKFETKLLEKLEEAEKLRIEKEISIGEKGI